MSHLEPIFHAVMEGQGATISTRTSGRRCCFGSSAFGESVAGHRARSRRSARRCRRLWIVAGQELTPPDANRHSKPAATRQPESSHLRLSYRSALERLQLVVRSAELRPGHLRARRCKPISVRDRKIVLRTSASAWFGASRVVLVCGSMAELHPNTDSGPFLSTPQYRA